MAQRQSSTSSRPSQHSRASFHIQNPDVFSDDFALEAFEIADGFGPASRPNDGFDDAASRSGPYDHTERSIAQQHPLESAQGFPRRSVGSQRHSGRNSLSSRHDMNAPLPFHPARTPSVSDNPIGASTPPRSISSASTFTMPRTQSPYQGATGPSQPYGLYPQNIGVSRTPSSATASTVRMPERIYTGPVGPTQPYGMYPQNTVPEDEVSPVHGITPAPLGFPGSGQDYRRRFGPDGEDAADLVGPDGHTEQLPPYTRYPNDLPPKGGPPEALPATVSPVSPVTTPENHVEVSQDALLAAQSDLSEIRRPTIDDSSTQLNPVSAHAAARPDSRGNFKESISEKSKRRVCWDRLPIWAVVLFLLVAGILIGAVIGGILGHKAGQEKATQTVPPPAAASQSVAASTVFVTTTSLVDAVPVTSTPTDLPPLPTGSFALKLGTPILSPSTCINNQAETSAWQCANGADLNFEIQQDCHFNLLNQDPTVPIRYGAQPPHLPSSTKMQLMYDKDGWKRGPAFFFQQAFDKIVVVRESDFTATNVRRSLSETGEYDELAVLEDRDITSYGPPDPVATIGSKPWYCFWNGTMLEGFIFTTQDTNSSNASTSVSSLSGQPPYLPIPSMTNMGSSAEAASSSSTSGSWPKRDILPPTNLAPFPKVVKIEERRNYQNPVQPYCQRMQILNNGSPGPLPNQATGQPITFNLTENEPQQQPETYGPPRRRRTWHFRREDAVKKRTAVPSSCECQWLSP